MVIFMNKYLIYAAIVFCVGVVGFVIYSTTTEKKQEQVEQESLDSLIGKPLKKQD